MSGNFSQAGLIVFVFSVYNVVYCNNAHSKLKRYPLTMLKWATIGPPLHSNEWVQLLLLFLLLLPLCVHACMWARMRGEVRSMV